MTTRTHRIAAASIVATLALASAAPIAAQSPDDREAITRTALDYIEGFYTGDAARMERALHPDLAKRIQRIDAAGRARIDQQTAEQLIALTRSRAGVTPPAVQQKDVTVLDVFKNTATVKVVANAWVDYLHLVKADGHWRIINVLWEMK